MAQEELPQEPQLELPHQVYHQACPDQIAKQEDLDAIVQLKTNALLDHLDQKEFLDAQDLKDSQDLMVFPEKMPMMLHPKTKTFLDVSTVQLAHKDPLGQLADLGHADMLELKDKAVYPDVMEIPDIPAKAARQDH